MSSMNLHHTSGFWSCVSNSFFLQVSINRLASMGLVPIWRSFVQLNCMLFHFNTSSSRSVMDLFEGFILDPPIFSSLLRITSSPSSLGILYIGRQRLGCL